MTRFPIFVTGIWPRFIQPRTVSGVTPTSSANLSRVKTGTGEVTARLKSGVVTTSIQVKKHHQSLQREQASRNAEITTKKRVRFKLMWS
jgi:thiamine monophosphate synthase